MKLTDNVKRLLLEYQGGYLFRVFKVINAIYFEREDGLRIHTSEQSEGVDVTYADIPWRSRKPLFRPLKNLLEDEDPWEDKSLDKRVLEVLSDSHDSELLACRFLRSRGYLPGTMFNKDQIRALAEDHFPDRELSEDMVEDVAEQLEISDRDVSPILSKLAYSFLLKYDP